MTRTPSATDLATLRAKTRLEAVRLGVDTVGLEMTVLRECVRRITGQDDPPMREAQVELMHQITAAMRGHGDGNHVSAEAPTGTGKSLSGLVPAAVAALRGERTVISTESLALQAQIMDKDAPLVMDCVEAITGIRPTFAVHKGWSNYVCGRQAVETVDTITGRTARRTWANPAAELRDAATTLAKAIGLNGHTATPLITSGKGRKKPGKAATPAVQDQADLASQVSVAAWAVLQVLDQSSGDRNTYTGAITGRAWESVSVSSGDCLGDRCPLADMCLPKIARQKVMTADLMVTNHALLGVQATKQAKVVFGSKRLGRFDHLIVDECHALPQVVRNQGANEVSERALRSVVNAYDHLFTDALGRQDKEVAIAESLIADVVCELTERIGTQQGPVRLSGDTEVDPLETTGPAMELWLTMASGRARDQLATLPAGAEGEIQLNRLISKAEQMRDALNSVRVGQPGVARWMEMTTGRDGIQRPVAQSSPVDVSPMLRSQLWVVDQPETFDDSGFEAGEEPGGDQERSRESITVAAISATVPRAFTVQAGLSTRTTVYDTPFDDAYEESALYVPQLTEATADQVCRQGYRGRWQFDTRKHTAWAAPQITELVKANKGSALVLAATAEAGRTYAAQLRVALAGQAQVLSQFDGLSLREITAAWKADRNAVLVGTRSLMTGVDAPGETNSLVIIDRIPRSAGNPVDDARIEALVDAGVADDRWAADRMVYVADAGLLLAQAAGRLIRHATDRGMVAVLDPRLLRTSVVKYTEQTRQQLIDPLMMFGVKLTAEPDAVRWLVARQAAVAAA